MPGRFAPLATAIRRSVQTCTSASEPRRCTPSPARWRPQPRGTFAFSPSAPLPEGRVALVVFLYACDQRGDEVALRRRQEAVPHVEDKHDARRVAAIPGFVLDRVVKHPGAAFAPLAALRADAVAASWWHDQRQMDDQACVRDAGVRRDTGARRENREESGRRVAGNFAERRAREEPRSARAPRQVVLDRSSVLEEEIGAPTRRVVELAPLIDRRAGAHRDIWNEIACSFRERCARLCPDLVSRFIERIEPRIVFPVDELDRRQPREQQEGGLRREHPPPAEKDLQAGIEAVEPFLGMPGPRLPEPWLQERFERAVVFPHDFAGALYGGLHCWWRLRSRRKAAQEGVIHLRGALELSLPLEKPCLVQQRGEIAWVSGERLLERIALCGLVAQLALGQRDIDPKVGARRIKLRCPFQERPGRRGVARAERTHP